MKKKSVNVTITYCRVQQIMWFRIYREKKF